MEPHINGAFTLFISSLWVKAKHDQQILDLQDESANKIKITILEKKENDLKDIYIYMRISSSFRAFSFFPRRSSQLSSRSPCSSACTSFSEFLKFPTSKNIFWLKEFHKFKIHLSMVLIIHHFNFKMIKISSVKISLTNQAAPKPILISVHGDFKLDYKQLNISAINLPKKKKIYLSF